MSVEIVTLRLNLSLPDDRAVWQWMTTMCPADIRGRKQYLSRLVVSGLVSVAREQLRNNSGGVNVAFPPLPDTPSESDPSLPQSSVTDPDTAGVSGLSSVQDGLESHMRNRVKVLPKV